LPPRQVGDPSLDVLEERSHKPLDVDRIGGVHRVSLPSLRRVGRPAGSAPLVRSAFNGQNKQGAVWLLFMTNETKEWVTVGRCKTVGKAVQQIKKFEGSADSSLLLTVRHYRYRIATGRLALICSRQAVRLDDRSRPTRRFRAPTPGRRSNKV
jgi:hypothetical protein